MIIILYKKSDSHHLHSAFAVGMAMLCTITPDPEVNCLQESPCPESIKTIIIWPWIAISLEYTGLLNCTFV